MIQLLCCTLKGSQKDPTNGASGTQEWDVESQYDYFGARYYDARLGRFLSVDPLGGSPGLAAWSPYHQSYNNPLGFVDPTGMAPEVFINGDAADETTKQIQQSTSLSISRDATTGKLSASGEARTDADKALLTAINDKSNDVRVNATTSNETSSGAPLYIGAAEGVRVERGRGMADMTYNPSHADQAQEHSGDPGKNAIHEVLEGHSAAAAARQSVSGTYGPEASNAFSHSVQSEFFGKAHEQVGRVLLLPKIKGLAADNIPRRTTQHGIAPIANPQARPIWLYEKPY